MVNHSYYPLFNEEDYKQVLCVESFFSKEEIERLLAGLQTLATVDAKVGTETVEHAYRNSKVSFLTDNSWSWLYSKLASAVRQANSSNYNKQLCGIEFLQYTEYDESYSGFYTAHVDETKTYTGLRRSLSFSMQLSHPETYTGGEVVIYNGDQTFESNKQFGSITFFDSSLMHEVLPVTSGKRKSLVGWVLGPRV